MIRGIVRYIVIVIILYYISNYFNLSFKYDSINNFLTNMLVVSTMVFTLMGIWVAYLYPDALDKIRDQESKIINVDFSEAKARLKRLEFIVASILKSSFVVIIVMAIFILKVILDSIHNSHEFIPIIQRLILPVIGLISVMQFEAIINVMKANILFINELHSRKEAKEQEEDI